MKKLRSVIPVFLILLAISIQVKAQYVLKEADKQFELYNYDKAITLYTKAYKKKAKVYTAERLAACYKFQRNYKQSESWYAIAAGMADSPAEDRLYYAQALQSNSKYNEAKIQYNQYADQNKTLNSALKNIWLQSCDSAILWMKTPVSVSINNEKVLNSPQSDWAAVKYGEGVVFVSDRLNAADVQKPKRAFLKFDGAKSPNKTTSGWTGNHYFKLYSQNENDNVKLVPIEAETDYHVGPASFTANGNEIYFAVTRIPKSPDYQKDKIIENKLATVNIEIYSSRKDENGKWSSPVPFKYNNVNEYSNGDPYITADGQNLYFYSSMPGGKGGTDLYVSHRSGSGDWSLPVNLKELNTEWNERSPIPGADNNFYFSSDGRAGMGGLDIYSTKLTGDTAAAPRNLRYPINSPQDDFAYNLNTENKGYFSSNRKDGLGEDDIYSFILQQMPAFRLSGIVYNRKLGTPLSNAVITLNKADNHGLKIKTDETGKFQFTLEKESDYSLTGEKGDYRNDRSTLSTKNLQVSTEIKKDLYLEPIEINKEIRLENIYYDFAQIDNRSDAAVDLDKLVKILQDNPKIWIELASHTDSRGKSQYNQWLSQSRAKSAAQYIINRGISKNRITAVGYGETRLLNKCANGVKCTEAEHQLNRRTEFKITRQ